MFPAGADLPPWPRYQQFRSKALIFYDAKQPGPNPVVVRLFVHERKGLRFDVELIDLAGLENRKPAYRAYLEIVLPFVTWWRGTDAAEEAYRGHRILMPEARRSHRLLADQGLNQFDEDLEGKTFIAGNDLTMADIMLYGFMGTNTATGEIPWLNVPQRPNVATWFDRMAAREASQKMMTALPASFSN
ncbi:glutathione S-transferase family protein [Neorhizobium petrolearium]|uniref:glutathione S-transferase family protein n=1 Tax=Neorhizobium petrolearium TaxID=515361 RepID=UPI003F13AAF5